MKLNQLTKILQVVLLGLTVNLVAHADDSDFNDYHSNRQVIDCSSSGYQYSSCPVSGRPYQVRLLNQYSHSACIEGQSYGITDFGVWVDKGCRGQFEVIVSEGDHDHGGHHGDHDGHDGDGHHGGYDNEVSITCSSSGYKYASCEAGGYIRRVELASQLSHSACELGTSWGYTQNYIWVDKGCRASFRVYVQR